MFSLLLHQRRVLKQDIITCMLRCWRYMQFSTFLRIYTGAQETRLYETVYRHPYTVKILFDML